MSSITLLTDGSNYSGLFQRNLKQKGDNVIMLTEQKSDDAESKNDDESLIWNKRSALSARNLMLSVLNRHGKLDQAVLIYQPGGFSKTFHETSSAVYDLQVDRWIKGYGYLLKELIQQFLRQQSGRLAFILDNEGIKVQTPLEAAIFSYLRTMIQNLGVLYQNESFRIYGFEAETTRKEEFLDFFFKTVDDSKYTPGKIHRFGDRKSLFDFSRG